MDAIQRLQNVFFEAWSLESSSKWTIDHPAKGQCSVTALVAHDLFGGQILKTTQPDGWHFYNKVNGERIDFTESQFDQSIYYEDIPSSREEAFLDTNEKQYTILTKHVCQLWELNL